MCIMDCWTQRERELRQEKGDAGKACAGPHVQEPFSPEISAQEGGKAIPEMPQGGLLFPGHGGQVHDSVPFLQKIIVGSERLHCP